MPAHSPRPHECRESGSAGLAHLARAPFSPPPPARLSGALDSRVARSPGGDIREFLHSRYRTRLCHVPRFEPCTRAARGLVLSRSRASRAAPAAAGAASGTQTRDRTIIHTPTHATLYAHATRRVGPRPSPTDTCNNTTRVERSRCTAYFERLHVPQGGVTTRLLFALLDLASLLDLAHHLQFLGRGLRLFLARHLSFLRLRLSRAWCEVHEEHAARAD